MDSPTVVCLFAINFHMAVMTIKSRLHGTVTIAVVKAFLKSLRKLAQNVRFLAKFEVYNCF